MAGIIRVLKKFTSILSRHQKFRLFELAVLMTMGGFFEVCSVSLVLPFMNAVLNPEETMDTWYVEVFCRFFSIQSSKGFLMVTAVILAMLYIVKNLYLLFEFNVQYKFVYSNMFAMQNRLLESYINRPYEHFLKINSGEVVRIMNIDTPGTFTLLLTLLTVFTEMIVSAMLIATLFAVAPVVTFCMAVALTFLISVIHAVIKPILRSAGKRTQFGQAAMNKWLLQSIQGIKELKVMDKKNYFQDNFNDYGKIYINSVRQQYILGIMPRFMIEAISMSVFFAVIAIMIYFGATFRTLAPMLSAVAMAAIRLLPSVNRISSSLASVAYYETMLDKLIENLSGTGDGRVSLAAYELKLEEKEEKGKIVFDNSLIMKNISYHYPDTETWVVDHADVEIKKGEFIGIIGPSGSGKSTTVDILLGLLQPQEGSILIDGVDISDNLKGWLHMVGYIPQSIFMLDSSIKANVAFGVKEEQIDEEAVIRALEEASLIDFVKTLPDGMESEIGERGVRLSGGQRQRIGIARALYTNPQVLFFDEATSALDNETERMIMESINHLRGKKTLIMVAHRLSTLDSCDRILKVSDGKIVDTKKK